MRADSGIVIVALIAAIAAAPAAAADGYKIVQRAGVQPEVAQAVGAALDRCLPYYTGLLKTPLAGPIDVHIYPTREGFAQGLIDIGREPAARAQAWARTATWFAAGPNIFVLQERVARAPTPDVVGGMCSAVGIVLQRQLLTDRSAEAHTWLRQGHSFLLALTALDSFGMASMAAGRQRAAAGIRQMQERGPLPKLSAAATLDGYQALFERYGTNATYLLRAAAEFLVSKTSQDAVVGYYRGLAITGTARPDPERVFQASFGMTADAFQTQFDTHLAAVLR